MPYFVDGTSKITLPSTKTVIFVDGSQRASLPPVPAMVEHLARSFRAAVLLVERNLVADTELNEFRNMKVGLAAGLEIEIVEETVSQTETDIVAGFFAACSVR